jgi:hypothetical protein
MLPVALLLVAGILGCGEKPGPVEEPKAVVEATQTAPKELAAGQSEDDVKAEEGPGRTAQEPPGSRAIAETTQTAPNELAAGQSEDYVKVDLSELAFSFRCFGHQVVPAPEGAKPIGGEVEEFTCEGRTLELASKHFEDGFIVTKEYGKIKVRFSFSPQGESFSLWLTPTQRKALLSLKNGN